MNSFDGEQFTELIQQIREDYYLGHIQEAEALETLQAIMRDYQMLDCDEELVGLPENFRSTTGYLGVFRVKHERSPYVWSRSYGLPLIGPTHISDLHTGEFNGPVVGNDFIDGYDRPGWRDQDYGRNPCAEITLGSPALDRRYDLPFSPLSEKDKAFFAPYEKQMTDHLVKGGKRKSARL